MKDHWSTSNDKLVGADEKPIRNGEIPLDLKPTRKSKQLIQCVKLILYLELLLFVGWACYSTWQTYRIESIEVKVMDSIREPESQSLLGQHSTYDKTSTVATPWKSGDDVAAQTENMLQAETAQPESTSEVDENIVATVIPAKDCATYEECTEGTTQIVTADPVTTIVNSDSTEKFDEQPKTETDEMKDSVQEIVHNEEFLENYLLLSLMLQNARVAYSYNIPEYASSELIVSDSQNEKSIDDVDEKFDVLPHDTAEQTYPVYDDIVVSDESTKRAFPVDSQLNTDDRLNLNRKKHSESVSKEVETVSKWTFPDDSILNTNDDFDLYRKGNSESKDVEAVNDESIKWTFPDDSILNTNDDFDLYRKGNSESKDVEAVNDESIKWTFPDDPILNTNDNFDLYRTGNSESKDVKPVNEESIKWTFPDDPILNTNDNSDLYRTGNSESKDVEAVSDESIKWTFPDDPILNMNDNSDLYRTGNSESKDVKPVNEESIKGAFPVGLNADYDYLSLYQRKKPDSVSGFEEVKESASEEKSNEKSLGSDRWKLFYNIKDYGVHSGLDYYYDDYMTDGIELHEKKETINESSERKSLESSYMPPPIGLFSFRSKFNTDQENNENDKVQIPSATTNVNYPDSEASPSQNYDSLESFVKQTLDLFQYK